MAAEDVEGQQAWLPTHEAAWRYVGSLDQRIRGIAALLGAPVATVFMDEVRTGRAGVEIDAQGHRLSRPDAALADAGI